MNEMKISFTQFFTDEHENNRKITLYHSLLFTVNVTSVSWKSTGNSEKMNDWNRSAEKKKNASNRKVLHCSNNNFPSFIFFTFQYSFLLSIQVISNNHEWNLISKVDQDCWHLFVVFFYFPSLSHMRFNTFLKWTFLLISNDHVMPQL